MTIGGLQDGNDRMESDAMGAMRIAEGFMGDTINALHSAIEKIDEVWGVYATAFGDEIVQNGQTAQKVLGLCKTANEKIEELIGQVTKMKEEGVPEVLATLAQATDDISTYIAVVSGATSS